MVDKDPAYHNVEQALEESEELFSTVFEYAPIGLALVSPDFRWLRVNRSLCDLVGYSEAELLAVSINDMTHPEDLLLGADYARRTLAGECRSFCIEKRYLHKGGQIIIGSLHVSLVRDPRGQPRCFIAQIKDITESRRLETQLYQTQKMETVGRLAGGVAHEFHGLLTTIIGQSEILLDHLPERSLLAGSAHAIRLAADRAATLTRQLLAYGRKEVLQLQILDLNTVLADLESTLRLLLGQGAEVVLALGAGRKTVKMDLEQIKQVIVNLALNAAQAMPQGGKLTLETASVTLGQDLFNRRPEGTPGQFVMLSMTDTGVGMSQQVKARLFEPFFTTKGADHATGLGLSTCHGIIKQSGGFMRVYSAPAQGATFRIYLPQVEPPVKTPTPQPDSPDLPAGTETILLVEDLAALREMSATLLGRLGYTVLAAASGLEALGLQEQGVGGQIDLLLTVVSMPNMSGLELADRVRAFYPAARILFTSRCTENAILHNGVLHKGMSYLQKPFTPSALAHKLREVLDE